MINQYGKERLQVRCEFDTNRIHIQGVGEKTVNRKYGMALELQSNSDVTNWLLDQEPTLVSPASGNLLYIEAQLHTFVEDNNQMRLLFLGDNLNHPQGAVLELDMSEENLAVQALIDFAKNNGLIHISAGEAFTAEEDAE